MREPISFEKGELEPDWRNINQNVEISDINCFLKSNLRKFELKTTRIICLWSFQVEKRVEERGKTMKRLVFEKLKVVFVQDVCGIRHKFIREKEN